MPHKLRRVGVGVGVGVGAGIGVSVGAGIGAGIGAKRLFGALRRGPRVP